MWVFLRDGEGLVTAINLAQAMTWSDGVIPQTRMETGEDKGPAKCITIQFAAMGVDLMQNKASSPWTMRLTGSERLQFIAYIKKHFLTTSPETMPQED